MNVSGESQPDHQGNPVELALRHLQQQALLAEAEEATHGVLHLTVDTGDPESAEDIERAAALHATAWAGRPGAWTLSVGGGNDYTTIRITGPCANHFLDELVAKAAELDPGWWRIRRSAR